MCSGLGSVKRMGMDAEHRKRFQQPFGRLAPLLCAHHAQLANPLRIVFVLFLVGSCWTLFCGPSFLVAGEVAIDFPVGDPELPIRIRADRGAHWKKGSYEVWYLQDFFFKVPMKKS